MTRTVICTALIAALLWGCSSTTLIHPTSNADMNAQMEGRDAVVELNDGTSLEVKQVIFFKDSVSWLNRDSDVQSALPLKLVNKILIVRKNDHAIGALEGFGIGFLATALPLLLTYEPRADIHDPDPFVSFVIQSGLGSLIGLVIGAVSAHTYYDEIQFNVQKVSQSDSLRFGRTLDD